jgi:hypothetical protein
MVLKEEKLSNDIFQGNTSELNGNESGCDFCPDSFFEYYC